MASYKEIVTKAVVGKGKKNCVSEHMVSPQITPTTILGCWVINHNFNGIKNNDDVTVNGSFDVNIWYSKENNTSTEVIKDTINYSEKIKVKMSGDNYDGNEDIIIRSLKQPTCNKAEIIDGKIKYSIEKELAAEVVGDAKIKVGINEDDEEEMEEEIKEENTENENIEQEINNTVKEDFL